MNLYLVMADDGSFGVLRSDKNFQEIKIEFSKYSVMPLPREGKLNFYAAERVVKFENGGYIFGYLD